LAAAKPLIASAIEPNPGRWEYGPSWPKVVTREITNRGLVQEIRAEFPAFQRSRAEILDQYVRVGDQAEQNLSSSRSVEVSGNHFLVASDGLPPQSDAILGDSVLPAAIWVERMFHLDDVGAIVSQIGGGERCGEQGGHLDDLDSGQGQRTVGRGLGHEVFDSSGDAQ